MYIKKEELLNMLEDRKSAVNKVLEKSITYEVCRSLVEEENIIDSIIEEINDLTVYDEQKVKTFNDEIKVGDEIVVKVPYTNREISGIVYKIDRVSTILYCISITENRVFMVPFYKAINNKFTEKTGRHFPQITSLMSKISTP